MRDRTVHAVVLVASIIVGAVFAVVVPSAPAHAQYPGGGAIGGGGGGLTQGLADTLYCQLTGCTMTGGLVSSSGSASAPAVAIGESNSGLYRIASNRVGFTVNGSDKGEVSATQWLLRQQLSISGVTNDITTPGSEDLTLAPGGRISLTACATILRGNLLGGSTSATDSGTGSCSSVTVTGTVLDFSITATCTAGQTVAVSFSSPFGGAARCSITPANSAASAATGSGLPYRSAGTTNTATYTFPSAVTAGTYDLICTF